MQSSHESSRKQGSFAVTRQTRGKGIGKNIEGEFVVDGNIYADMLQRLRIAEKR